MSIGSDSDSDTTSGSDGTSSSRSDGNGNGNGNASADVNGGSNGEADLESRYQEIAKIIAGAQKRNIRHDAAEVAMSSMPFEDMEEMHAYILALGNALVSSEYPAGFGLNEEYESVESYKTGRSSRPLIIPLPHDVWFPRIVVWCRALDLLKRLPMCRATVGR